MKKLNLVLLLLSIFSMNILVAQNFWEKTNFPSDNSSLYSVYSLIENSNNEILAGTYAKGIFKSSDNGNTWSESGLANQWVISLVKSKTNIIYAASIGSSLGSGVYKSEDNGSTWTNIWEAVTGMNCLFCDNNNNIYVGLNYSQEQSGIYYTTDDGDSWNKIFSMSENIYSITKLGSGRILAAGYGKVFYSDNNGSSWSTTSDGLVNSTPSDFVVSSSGEIFLATLGYGIFKSQNNGETWINLTGAGPEYSCLIYNNDGSMYAGTKGNYIYRSLNSGANWELINSGMNQDKYVLSLLADKAGYIYAGLDYNGLYKSVEKVVTKVETGKEIFDEYNLSQNYPNPFNPTTIIEYSIPSTEFVSIKIYDMLGKEIAVLINEEQKAGNYKVKFDASNLTSGVYFYKINTDNFNLVRKMMLLK